MAPRIKIDPDLFERVRKIVEQAGYSSPEEFIIHVIGKSGHGQVPETGVSAILHASKLVPRLTAMMRSRTHPKLKTTGFNIGCIEGVLMPVPLQSTVNWIATVGCCPVKAAMKSTPASRRY